MLKAIFSIQDEEKLYETLIAEENDLQTHRARVDIQQNGNTITITLEAKDFSSFRALESAIMRLLTTFFKMKTVGEKNE